MKKKKPHKRAKELSKDINVAAVTVEEARDREIARNNLQWLTLKTRSVSWCKCISNSFLTFDEYKYECISEGCVWYLLRGGVYRKPDLITVP